MRRGESDAAGGIFSASCGSGIIPAQRGGPMQSGRIALPRNHYTSSAFVNPEDCLPYHRRIMPRAAFHGVEDSAKCSTNFFRKTFREGFPGPLLQGPSRNPSVHIRLKSEKMDFQPYKNPFFTDPILQNAVLNRTFHGMIRLKDQKICFLPYRTARKYGYR